MFFAAVLSAASTSVLTTAHAQDLYDTATLRTVNLTFAQPNWETQLRMNHFTGIDIAGDLEVEGTTYLGVGVRIRGNTSFTTLPLLSQKYSLNISMDFTVPGQELLGYDTLNLNNAHRDPTFAREMTYSNLAAQYIPGPRANHVLLTINGESWGVYVNVQQFNKDLLRDYFDDEDGMRVKVGNPVVGPGLQYMGPDPMNYSAYEIKNDGGLADPIGAVIALCDAVANGDLTNWRSIDEVLAVDPSLWALAVENIFADDDGYMNEGKDFVMYQNPVDGRTHLLPSDGNETWRELGWAATHNFGDVNKPLLSHVLSVPELRQRYMAHLRTLLEDFDWAHLGPTFTATKARIDAHVLADTKKLYSYQNFVDNYTSTVVLAGLLGGPVVGLQEFVDMRSTLLLADPEVTAPAPTISWVRTSMSRPAPTEPVVVTSLARDLVSGLERVDLWFQAGPSEPFDRVQMLDDGLSGDGSPGDGVFGATLPVTAMSGQTVRYYVAATASSSYASMTFEPKRTEIEPLEIEYSFGGTGLRISEYMYSGAGGEFFELANASSIPIDLTGWSFDDSSADPGTFDLSAAGVLMPGEAVIVCEEDPAAFIADWGLMGTTVLGPNSTATLGRNDQIWVFDQGGGLVERLRYGDEDFPGTYRARNETAQVCEGGLGSDDPYLWVASEIGDPWGSFASNSGDIGSPGVFSAVACPRIGSPYCTAEVNSTGMSASIGASGSIFAFRNDLTLSARQLPPFVFGIFLNSTDQAFIPNAGGGSGNLCLGGAIGRHWRPGEILNTGAAGEVSLLLELDDFPTPTAYVVVVTGETRNFQFWHRDSSPASTSNYTNGLSVKFR